MSRLKQISWWKIWLIAVGVVVLTALITTAIQRLLFGKTIVAGTSAVVTVAIGAIGIIIRSLRRSQYS